MRSRLLNSQAGVTLVELIVAMIVISIAVGGVLVVLNYTTSHSADPVLRHQAVAIAEAYMEEITLKSFTDPDGSEAGETRATFDDVDDYHGLDDSGAIDQTGNPVAGLGNYRVEVDVTAENYGPAGSQVAGLKIEVKVTDPAGEDFTLTGYRASY
jgi:MSHA pilin protein MshD